MKILFVTLSLSLSSPVFAQGFFSTEKKEESRPVLGSVTGPAKLSREVLLGHILSGTLHHLHLAKKTIDDELSREAFKLYLERVDYGKQFLTADDVKRLRAFEDRMDDELTTGQLKLIDVTAELMQKRIPQVESWIDEITAKPFDYKKSETLETDGEKRSFAKDEKELRAFWGKLLKYDAMSRFADLKEERDQDPAAKAREEAKDKKKKKKSAADGEDISKMDDAALETKARRKTAESFKKILSRLKAEKRNDKLDKFYNSIARVFDPHTHYLIPEEKEDFDIDMSGKLEGIGAILREEGSYIKVERIVPGSASWKTKELDAEDTILKVAQGKEEPVEVVDMPLRDAVKLIRGKKGSEVRLTVKKPNGLIKTIPIVRDVVEIEESFVKGTVIEHAPTKTRVGYINVPKFYRDFNDRLGRNCTDDVRRELQRLRAKKVQGLILDLRNNGGGALEDARMISGLFIEKGPIVQVKDSAGNVEVLADNDPTIEFDKPVVILINRFSASASEIVAAALQDYGRAIIMGGEFSHGKGTVQLVVDLDNYAPPMGKVFSPLGALKITIQKFFRVNGSSTQYRGVTPDIILPDPYAHLESGEQFLKHSIPWASVKPNSFKPWPKKLDRAKLVAASQARVKASARFKRIQETVDWYAERRKLTQKDISLEAFLRDRKEVKTRSEELEKEVESEDVVVTSLDPLKDKLAQDKFDEFRKSLRIDPVIEESLFVIRDML